MANFLSRHLRTVLRRAVPERGLPEFLPWPGGGAPTLVVFVHEWASGGASRLAVKRFLYGEGDGSAPGADGAPPPLGPVDLLLPLHTANALSNRSPYRLARELQKQVHRRVMERERQQPYRRVVLAGYSAGSLLIRKAIVWGLGEIEDHPDPDEAHEHAWTWALDPRTGQPSGRIERVVLIAGMNRGWSLDERPKDMRRRDYLAYSLLLPLVRLPFTGRFIARLERGEPFVVDLRVQWLRLGWKFKERMIPTIQLLGTVDDIVSRDDNKDVLAIEHFRLILVPYTNHLQILHLDDKDHGAERRRCLGEALWGAIARDEDRALDEIKRRSDRDLQQGSNVRDAAAAGRRAKVSMIVFLVHGIRDNADWGYEVRRKILNADPNAFCVCSSYGHLSMMQFLLFPVRRRRVRWFMDAYTEAIAQVGDPHVPVHFVGHSNGTYLLARGLVDYHTLRIDRAILTGSVVERHFPWSEHHRSGRVRVLQNERAASDWVVGIFPGFYQLLGRFVPFFRSFSDIGDGGLRGFDRPAGLTHEEVFYLRGGHGAGVDLGNQDHLVDFVLGRPMRPRDLRRSMNATVLYLSNLCWLVWLGIAFCLILLPSMYLSEFHLLAWLLFVLAVIATI